MRIYLNIEYTTARTSYVFFASKKQAIINAKRWTSDEEYLEAAKKRGDKIIRIETYTLHDDCQLGYFLAELENAAREREQHGIPINVEYAE